MLEWLAGCLRTILCQPRPLEVNAAPSNPVLHHGAYLLVPRFATHRDKSLPSPWHIEVVVTARRAAHTLGRVCLCDHAPWGYCKTNHWVVTPPLAVRHTLRRPGVADLGPISAKIAHDKQK